jgi:putative nucleotidyltransferase with HDIG domain
VSPADPNPLPRATLRELTARAICARRGERCDPADRAWAQSILTPAEFELWSGLSEYDQHHTIQVARRVERRLAPTAYGADSLWPAAALLHDIGKREADLSLFERALATLASRVVGVDRARRWTSSPARLKRRVGIYLVHGEVGARLIRSAGGREAIAAWTEVHQGDRPLDGLEFPAAVVEALIKSDVA